MANIKSIYGNPVVDDNLRQSVATEYSSSSTYAVGDLCLKDGVLYECTTAISTAEAWTAAHWTAVTVGEKVADLKEETTSLKDELSTTVNPFISKWNIGKTISGTGEYGNNNYSATTPLLYDATDKYQYTGATKDSDNVGFYLYVHEYDANCNWLSRRTVFGVSDVVTIPIDIERSSSNVKYFRFVFGRVGSSGITFTESDLQYFGITQVQNKAKMIPIQPNPTGYISDGTVNALFSLAEEYLNYAYQKENISGLIYASENDANASSAYSPTVEPIQTVGGIKQYSIQCSGLANLLIRAVSFDNSRYTTGTSGKNISLDWGYHFDDYTLDLNVQNKNILWSYELYKYAVEHGFGYIVNKAGNNVRPGDLLFTSVFAASGNYMQIEHAMVVLNCGEDGKATVVEASTATRTSEGVDYPVGLHVYTYDLTAANNQVIYGARYPLGTVSKKAETIFTYNPNFSGTVNNDTIINKSVGVEGLAKQGLYTIQARGDFSAVPNVAVKYKGASTYSSFGKMSKSGNIYSMTLYATDEIAVIALLNASGSQMTVTSWDHLSFVHGFISGIPADDMQGKINYAVSGYLLNGGEDLNNVDVGKYTCGSGSIAASLLNCPTTSNFYMECIYRTIGGGFKTQIIYASDNSIYMRNQSSSSWGKWYKFTGTALS